MHITLRHLSIFEAVAKHGSVSRAASELHLTQPAVSTQVKNVRAQWQGTNVMYEPGGIFG